MKTPSIVTANLLLSALAALGCGLGNAPLRAELTPLHLGGKGTPAVLEQDHFKRDLAGSISEEHLRQVLAAPVFLEDSARVGVIQVAGSYQPDAGLPLAVVPSELVRAIEAAGLFEAATEISTDWPADRGVFGLRELAARYRSDYLLLYRHRFVDRTYTNGWGWLYVTVLGILVAPSQTIDTAGVLEATLFDVKTGTLLFSVLERVHSSRRANIWQNQRKLREIQSALLASTAGRLADKVVDKCRRLAARRLPPPAAATPAPVPTTPSAPAAAAALAVALPDLDAKT